MRSSVQGFVRVLSLPLYVHIYLSISIYIYIYIYIHVCGFHGVLCLNLGILVFRQFGPEPRTRSFSCLVVMTILICHPWQHFVRVHPQTSRPRSKTSRIEEVLVRHQHAVRRPSVVLPWHSSFLAAMAWGVGSW